MFPKLLILFIAVPLIEIAILIEVGSVIGTFNTIALVIFTAVLGAYMVRLEGLNVLYRFQNNLAQGVLPAEEMLEGAMLLVAGALLLTPGIATDVIGFLLVIPQSRGLIKRYLKRYIEAHYTVGRIDHRSNGF